MSASEDLGWYKHRPKSYTALLLGEVSEHAAPQNITVYFGKEAYENLHLSIYLRELLRIRDTDHVCWSPGFGLLWAAMRALAGSAGLRRFFAPRKRVVVEEIGSSLYATIDKLVKLRARYGGKVDLRKATFWGVEPSLLFTRTAEELHREFDVRHVDRVGQLPQPDRGRTVTFGRSYQATSYAFDATAEFCDWIARARFSLHGAWFAVTPQERSIDVLGKRTTLFSAEETQRLLRAAGHAIYPLSSERYTFGAESFYSVFFAAHDLNRAEEGRLLALCDRHECYGVDRSRLAEVPDLGAWIRAQAVDRGEHSQFIANREADGRKSPTFDFNNAAVAAKFQEHVAAVA
jgi:hypothetical protein